LALALILMANIFSHHFDSHYYIITIYIIIDGFFASNTLIAFFSLSLHYFHCRHWLILPLLPLIRHCCWLIFMPCFDSYWLPLLSLRHCIVIVIVIIGLPLPLLYFRHIAPLPHYRLLLLLLLIDCFIVYSIV